MSTTVLIACCPEHGLHGERTECFVCGGEVEQVAMTAAPLFEHRGRAAARFALAARVHLAFGVCQDRAEVFAGEALEAAIQAAEAAVQPTTTQEPRADA